MLLKVENNPDLVRNKENSAILNLNNMELNKYKSDRDKKIKLNNIVNEFDELKKEVARLTNLVEEFIIRK